MISNTKHLEVFKHQPEQLSIINTNSDPKIMSLFPNPLIPIILRTTTTQETHKQRQSVVLKIIQQKQIYILLKEHNSKMFIDILDSRKSLLYHFNHYYNLLHKKHIKTCNQIIFPEKKRASHPEIFIYIQIFSS